MTTPAPPKGQEEQFVAITKDGQNLKVPPGFGKGLGGDIELARGIVDQVFNIGSKGPKADQHGSNFVFAQVAGIAPKDAIETMLAMQMAAVHNATMTFTRRLAHVDTITQQDSASRALNQLCRTFAAQVDALKRYRSSGQQVVVKHVTVNDGGQAIVGNVSRGEGQT